MREWSNETIIIAQLQYWGRQEFISLGKRVGAARGRELTATVAVSSTRPSAGAS